MSKTARRRALLVTTDYPPEIGGLQTYAYRIATALPGGMLRAVLVGTDRARRVLPPPAPGVALASRHGRTRWKAFAWSLWSLPWMRLRYDAAFLLHMQWTTALPSLLLRKLVPRTRYVVLVHGAELIDPERWLVARLKRAVLGNADAVVAGSLHTAEIVSQLGIRCRRLEVIPYGNPLEGRPGPPPGESIPPVTPGPRLLCMHRLVARKGTALLLEALADLKGRAWGLDIVGRGEEEESLRALVVRLRLQDRVRFLAPVDEDMKMRLLRGATLFILPSLPPVSNNHVEGLGLTLLEAQSQGIPVLAARTGGIPEAVREGLTGALFRAGDAEDLREKLAALLAAPEKLREMGKAGPAWVRENFSWEKSLRRLAELMGEIGEGRN
jgi:phosphatidylinositol alpha-1,6-mannosyltransferase